MKKSLSFIILFSLLISLVSLDQPNKVNHCKDKYKIVEIDSTKNLYIYYAKRNDSIFKLLSKKTDNNNCSKSIKENEVYTLKFRSIFSANFSQKTEISQFEFDGSYIKLGTNESVWDLYVSENINGLCYIE